MNAEREKAIDWHTEALAVIKDVKEHVKSIAISEKLITGKILCCLVGKDYLLIIYE